VGSDKARAAGDQNPALNHGRALYPGAVGEADGSRTPGPPCRVGPVVQWAMTRHDTARDVPEHVKRVVMLPQ
jgi:hypothetical protein